MRLSRKHFNPLAERGLPWVGVPMPKDPHQPLTHPALASQPASGPEYGLLHGWILIIALVLLWILLS